MKNKDTYIRIGSDYYKMILNQDSAGWPYEDVRPWTRQSIIDDFGKEYLKKIKKFDAVTNIPINDGDETSILPNLFNLYKPIEHTPIKGDWKWTEILFRHIFGDQYELGLDYVQLLYQQPLQILPILCLVSKENATGKTTFLNWLRMLFNSNIIIVGNQDIHGRFNSHYAHKLIIAVDESRIDKEASLEKLKSLSTQKTINYEGKFRDSYTIPFFGKFILCSNYEENFISAKESDVRFWIRKVPVPQNININIESDLESELPAFLWMLKTRKMTTKKQSRMWFTAEQIETTALKEVKYQSKSWLYKELDEFISSFFMQNRTIKEFKADPTDIKTKWFERINDAKASYIRSVLKKEYNLTASEKVLWYRPFEDNILESKSARPFTFTRDMFIDDLDYQESAKIDSDNEIDNNTKIQQESIINREIPF